MDANPRGDPDEKLSTMRLYGSAIAIVSGLYAIYLSTAGAGMANSAWFMLAIGIVVFVHGALLLTPAASTIGAASGPLMITYAALMLINQGWLASMDGAGQGGMPMDGAMSWNVGMVAIALLMLVSGAIMTSRSMDEGPRTGM